MIIPSNLPPEFHVSGQPSETMRKILCKYYGVKYIPIFVSRYARKANDEKIEKALYEETRAKNIPKATLVRQIVWAHYGYEAPAQEKVEMLDKKRRIRRKPGGNFKIFGVLAAANDYMLLWELAQLAGFSEVYCKFVSDKLWRSGYVEKVRENVGNLWCITASGRQEYNRLAEIFGVVPVSQRDTPIVRTEAHRKYISRQKRNEPAAMKIRRLADAKWIESFKAEKELRDKESGLRKYFLYDENNPIDAEIVKRFHERSSSIRHGFYGPYEDYFCRQILCRRLSLRCSAKYLHVNEAIENKLREWCKRKNMTRNELVRELFRIEFNIKTVEVG